jgi:hypothetical protein
MTIASVQVEEALLILKIAFLVLLYLFIWRIVRTASRDLRLPQESFVLAPQQAAGLGLSARVQIGKLVVMRSPAVEEGKVLTLDSAAASIGRGPQNDLPIPEDEFASAEHARFEPRRDGVWLEDLDSTNGTYVNGVKVSEPRRLVPGDVIRVGETDLRFER